MSESLVHILVPAYNSAPTLADTLGSLLSQTHRNLVVTVVDNASTDGTVRLAEEHAARDPRVRVLRHSENVGGEGNFNRCLALAAGDYSAIFHADDVYSPSMVQEMADFLDRNPEAGAVFTMAEGIDAAGKKVRTYSLPPELRRDSPSLYRFEEVFRAVLKYGNFFFCPGAMARSSLYRDAIRKWDARGFATSSDLDVWFRLLQLGPVGIIDKPLLRYRVAAPSSYSYTAARKKTGKHDIFKVLDFYAEGPASSIMGPGERADYAIQVLKDDANRAFNLLVAGDRGEARRLMSGRIGLRLAARAAGTPFQVKTILYAFTVRILACIPLPAAARSFLHRLRF